MRSLLRLLFVRKVLRNKEIECCDRWTCVVDRVLFWFGRILLGWCGVVTFGVVFVVSCEASKDFVGFLGGQGEGF